MVSVEKNEYDKGKKIEELTRKGAPVISLLGNVNVRRDRMLGNRTFNFAIKVLIV
jgi:hypothetical protein